MTPRNPLLTRIKDMPIKGNPDDDATLMCLIHELVMGDYPMDDKLEALEILARSSGEEEGPATVQDVLDYVKSFKEE